MLLTLIASGVAPWWLSGDVVTLRRVAIEAICQGYAENF